MLVLNCKEGDIVTIGDHIAMKIGDILSDGARLEFDLRSGWQALRRLDDDEWDTGIHARNIVDGLVMVQIHEGGHIAIANRHSVYFGDIVFRKIGSSRARILFDVDRSLSVVRTRS